MSKFMTGALLGLAVGLLVAPEKGEETREALSENFEKIKDKVLRLTGKAGARLDDLKKLLGHEIEGLSDDVRSRISTILEEESGKEDSSRPEGSRATASSASASKAPASAQTSAKPA